MLKVEITLILINFLKIWMIIQSKAMSLYKVMQMYKILSS